MNFELISKLKLAYHCNYQFIKSFMLKCLVAMRVIIFTITFSHFSNRLNYLKLTILCFPNSITQNITFHFFILLKLLFYSITFLVTEET